MSDPRRNPDVPIEERSDGLLSRMTREEKVGQLNHLRLRRVPVSGLEDAAREGRCGAVTVPSGRAGHLNDLQRVAVEESRLGVPLLYGADVIHGHRTIFPIPLAQAASWDPEVVQKAAACAACEAAADGIRWTFTPMMDIARDPRWGRIAESFGEDPNLASRMAEAAVCGYQGEDLTAPDRILACAKHYAGYGAAEGGRDYNTAEITDNTLRNVYLEPFRAAVAAGVGSVMAAFQEIGGLPVHASRYMLTEILKQEWGFDGFVISDAFAVEELISHGVAADRREAAGLSFRAGVDNDLWAECFADFVGELVESGEVGEERLDDAVRRILRAKFRLGLFENPYTDAERYEQVVLCEEHRAAARRAAVRSMVLLNNDGRLLPLSRELSSLAVLGPMADDLHGLMGCWNLAGRAEDVVGLVDALREALPDANVRTSGAQTDVMQAHARRANVVLFALGENNCRSGENNCVTTLELPAGQMQMVESVAALGKPTVAVVFGGRPLALGRLEELCDAVLFAWHPGTEAGHAVVDVLLGEVNPGGKLPVTFPRSVGQVPIHYNCKRTGRANNPGAGIYLDSPTEPLHPFGYGLSYAAFEYTDLRVSEECIPPDGSVEVSVEVRNVGERSGEEVVQCYVRDCVASTARPERELKGFRRVRLDAGEAKRVHFTLGEDELAFYGADGARRVEPGRFFVWVGGDSRAVLQGEFTVE